MNGHDRPLLLFVGSAISGVAPPYLPMLGPVLQEVTKSMVMVLREAHTHAVILTHAEELLAGNRHDYVLWSMKFEEFLFQVEAALGRPALDELLVILYGCRENEYGFNHAAIADLVRSGRVKACLTTNFDDALERAWPGWKVEHESLPNRIETHHLIKLHGDARSRTCVATSPVIERPSRNFSSLPELLRGHHVLVLGYSGLGDIDIAPELERASDQGVTFTWGVFNKSSARPRFVTTTVETNLAGVDKNALTELAPEFRQHHTVNGKKPEEMPEERRQQLQEWARRHRGAARFVAGMYHWRSPWPIVRMMLSEALEQPDSLAQAWALTQAFAQVGAFRSSLKQFESARAMAVQTSISENFQLQMDGHAGFCIRQLGDPAGAVRSLRPAVDKILDASIASQRMFKSALCRQYIESCRDLLYRTPPWNRAVLASSLRIAEVMVLLERWEHHAPSAENKVRQEIDCAELAAVGGRPTRHDLLRLSERAVNSQYYPAASAAARALILQDFRTGASQLLKVSKETWSKTRDGKVLIKNAAGFLLACVGNPWWLRRVVETPARQMMAAIAEFTLMRTCRRLKGPADN